MKLRTKLLTLAPILCACAVLAQEGKPPRPEGGPPGGRRPRPPIETVLDANDDGVIDAGEISNAAAALKKLDRNKDGKLSPDEYRPPRPGEPGTDPGTRPSPPKG